MTFRLSQSESLSESPKQRGAEISFKRAKHKANDPV